jgi:hypothetical protein
MPKTDRTQHDGDRENHHRAPSTTDTRNLKPAGPLPLQASAGNRSTQHLVAKPGQGGVIQRRLHPPALGRFLNRAVQSLSGSNTVFTRYVLQATNPSQEGVGTFVDVKGPLTG